MKNTLYIVVKRGIAVFDYKILKVTDRKWGTELVISAIEDGKEFNVMSRTFKPLPSGNKLKERILAMVAKRKQNMDDGIPEPEITMTEAEVVKMLVEKKYLTEGQTLDDLPVKVEVK